MRNATRVAAAVLAAAALLTGCHHAIRDLSGLGHPAPPQFNPPLFAARDTAAAALPPLTDGNILAMLLTVDSTEHRIADLAKARASNKAVHDLAEMVQDDHAKGGAATKVLVKTTGITPIAPAWDTTAVHAQHLLARLRATPAGLSFDTAYARAMVRGHAHMIAVTKTMARDARNDAIKNFVKANLPVMEKHLDQAQLAEQTLGVRP